MLLDNPPTPARTRTRLPAQVVCARLVATALAYFVTGKFGLDLAGAGSLVTLVWMPIGVAVAAFYHWGWRCWPAVWVGVMAVNLSSGADLLLGLWIALGNTAGPLLGVQMLRRCGFNRKIAGQRDVMLFVALAAALSATVTATNGSVALLAWGATNADTWAWTWVTWWIGDAVGVVLCGMALVTASRAETSRLLSGPEMYRFVGSIVGVLLISSAWMLAPTGPVVQILLCTFPVALVVWVAIKLGPFTAASATLWLAVLGAWAVTLGRGPFVDPDFYLALTKFWAYMVTLSVVSMLLSALNSERTQAHLHLVQAEERFRTLTQLSSDWYWEQDREFRFTSISDELQAKTGQANDAHFGKTRWELPYTQMSEGDWAEHRAVLQRHEPFRNFEISRVNAHGTVMHYAVSGAPMFDARKRFIGYRGVGHDITERKRAQEMIKRMAHFDALTDLPNRVLFPDRLDTEMRRAQRSGRKVALMMLDLDHFKEVNDTLGHDQGDRLLVQAAERLRNCVRAADTVARMGGDEFMVVLGELEDLCPVENIASNILKSLLQPYSLQGGTGNVTASIGIALYPDDGESVDALVKHADQAMYAAKAGGRNRFSFFTPELQANADARIWLAQDIRNALKNKQFWVAYQPIHSLKDESVQKAEALIRWQHPQRGLIEPAVFVPVAESNGLISEMGQWVFEVVVAEAKRWRHTHHSEFQISINRSPVQFYRPDGDSISWNDQLRAMGLAGRSIVVEIAESVLIGSSQSLNEQIKTLRGEGIQLSIDDFGSGVSSLASLHQHHIDYIKIDQAFVRRISPHSREFALSQAIIAMAHKLDIQVIAQGVETQQQRDLLQSAGCDFAQGYFYAHPMTATEFDAYLAAQNTLESVT